jgi:hypothetical protein
MKNCPDPQKKFECELWAIRRRLRKVSASPNKKRIYYSNLSFKNLIRLIHSTETPASVRKNVEREIFKRTYGI